MSGHSYRDTVCCFCRFRCEHCAPPAVVPCWLLTTGIVLGFTPSTPTPCPRQVRVKGQPCRRSLAVHPRGGFKWADPDDPAVRAALARGAGEPFGGGLPPGLREVAVLMARLDAAGEELGEAYLWLHAHAALDDSSGGLAPRDT